MDKSTVEILSRFGQSHIIEHMKRLSKEKRNEFIHHLKSFDLELPLRLFKSPKIKEEEEIFPPSIIEPPEGEKGIERVKSAREEGEKVLSENKVVFLLVAGGHGSRLGFEGPKGLFPITPVRAKSLFQIFSESIYGISKKYHSKPLFIIMTSEDTHERTLEFFENNRFFGLKDQTIIFRQESIPSLSEEGLLLLKDETHLLTNPDGHGGALKGLERGLLDDLLKRGFKYLFYFQVDNPLVKIGDPVFLGYHILEGAEISTKVVRKRHENERVGIYVRTEKGDRIIEYSEKDERLLRRNEKGELLFWAGNTAIHIFSLDFLKSLSEKGIELPYHRTEREAEVYDPEKGFIRKKVIKFEKFIFDLLPAAKRTNVVETKREEEFSPIKNSTGEDSPVEAKKAMVEFYKKILREEGVFIDKEIEVEISPILLVDRERLSSALKNLKIRSPLYIGEEYEDLSD